MQSTETLELPPFPLEENEFNPGPETGGSDGIFASLVSAYRRHEFQQNYEQARNELLASLVPIAEQYLQRRGLAARDPRKLIYGFVELIEAYLERKPGESDFVSDGLGI